MKIKPKDFDAVARVLPQVQPRDHEVVQRRADESLASLAVSETHLIVAYHGTELLRTVMCERNSETGLFELQAAMTQRMPSEHQRIAAENGEPVNGERAAA